MDTRAKLSGIFRAARKTSGMNQKEFTKALGITQGTVSKLENASLGPDDVLWYQFCMSFDLHPDLTYKTGKLFFNEPKEFSGEELKMGRLNLDRFVTVKDILPLLNTIEKYDLMETYEEELSLRRIDRDFILIPDYKIPFELLRNTIDFVNSNLTKKELMNSSVKFFIEEMAETIYAQSSSHKEFMSYISEQETFFDIKQVGKRFEVTLIPSLKFSLEEREALKTYINYKTKAIGQALSKLFSMKGVKVTKVDEFNYAINV